MNHVVNLAGAAIASTVTYATVLVAGFAGIVFLREELHFYEPIGAAIVIAGVILSKKMPKEVTL
jgi:drug/metabolite transporter (DMT)-like permease